MPLPFPGGGGGNNTAFIGFTPEYDDGVVVVPSFWQDLVGCVQAGVLTKQAADVVVPGTLAQPYRPSSKTCPPAPHTPRWVTKTLCGTVTHYLLLSGDQVVGYKDAYLINYNGKVVLDRQVVQMVVAGASSNGSQLAYESPFCAPVKVYE